MGKNRIVNENFFDEYKFFDAILSEHFHMESGGIDKYIDEMKNANYEACERIPEWNSILARLEHLRDRYNSLNNADTSFDEFQGKDEDVVWIRIFITKLQGNADPLSKYSQLVFVYKKRKKSLMQIIKEFFGQ